MLFFLLNLALIWGLLVLCFTLRSDYVEALLVYADNLETEITSICRRLEDNAWQRRCTAQDLAQLKRQQRLLLWKLRAMIIFLSFIKFPFDFMRFLLGIFSRRQ